jgi:hypothetical protein
LQTLAACPVLIAHRWKTLHASLRLIADFVVSAAQPTVRVHRSQAIHYYRFIR